jgi:hypothetical protein
MASCVTWPRVSLRPAETTFRRVNGDRDRGREIRVRDRGTGHPDTRIRGCSTRRTAQ